MMINANCVLALVLGLAAANAGAEDIERGRLLYENHCTVCHTSVVHVRDDRKATSPAELMHQIARWSAHLALPWQAAEREDVAAYLAQRYYRFPE